MDPFMVIYRRIHDTVFRAVKKILIIGVSYFLSLNSEMDIILIFDSCSTLLLTFVNWICLPTIPTLYIQASIKNQASIWLISWHLAKRSIRKSIAFIRTPNTWSLLIPPEALSLVGNLKPLKNGPQRSFGGWKKIQQLKYLANNSTHKSLFMEYGFL